MQRAGWLLLVFLVLVAGCRRESLKEKAVRATNKAGQVVGEGAGSFFTGVGEGVDKTVTTYDVRVADELKAMGVTVTIAKHMAGAGADSRQEILSFYVLNKSPLSGVLRVRLYNDKAQEIGRSTAQVAFNADDARYVPFNLDKEIPVTMTKYVELDLKKE